MRKSDVRVIVKADYRANGEGYLDPDRPSHIWTVPSRSSRRGPQKATQLTTGEFSEEGMAWSRDGSQIYFTSNRVREPYYEPPHDEIYVVKARGRRDIARWPASMVPLGASRSAPMAPTSLLGDINHGDNCPTLLQPAGSLHHGRRARFATPRNLTAAYDYDIGGGVGGDQAPPRGSAPSKPYWSADGRSIFVTPPKRAAPT
jgi:hypothetical protein